MRQVTESLIKQYYELFNQRKIEAFLALLDDKVIHDINQGETEVGIDAFGKFMQRMNHAYQEKVTDLVIMATEDGKRGSAEFFIDGVYLATDEHLPEASNQPYRLRCGAFFEINNNKIARVTNYYNMQHWLDQVQD
ncbi:MAG: nuclear transport factor 2 family protein [Proteobacteria bacterium]|nr:nuclear transport factor 2 family protein [Pseudomonadota bacterium]